MPRTPENDEHYDLFREMLGLQELDMVANFPAKPEQDAKRLQKQLKLMCIQLVAHLCEDIPEKYSHLYVRGESDQPALTQSPMKGSLMTKMSLRFDHIIAPVLLVLDDMQVYDALTFKLLASLLKSFDRISVVCVQRDSYLEPQLFKSTRAQDEVVLEGMAQLEEAFDMSQITAIQVKGLQRLDKEDEFIKFIRLHFNISTFQSEQAPPQDHRRSLKDRGRGLSLLDVTAQE